MNLLDLVVKGLYVQDFKVLSGCMKTGPISFMSNTSQEYCCVGEHLHLLTVNRGQRVHHALETPQGLDRTKTKERE